MQNRLPLIDKQAGNHFAHLLPKVEHVTDEPVPTYIWDIPYSIPSLSYLTHSHFRYYGKFPSSVAAKLLEDFPPPSKQAYVLDTYCGSGTTLVEAKLRGIDSYGLDVSWTAALASNVKTRFVDLEQIEKLTGEILDVAAGSSAPRLTEDKFRDKWFSKGVSKQLLLLRDAIDELKDCAEKDFILVAYLAIIRRVSRAYDGEVRPRINKEKKERDVYIAFNKKIKDMMKDHADYMALADAQAKAQCVVADNCAPPKRFYDKKCYLVVAHPPYLNSFDYSPVFSLENYWGSLFKENYVPRDFDPKSSEIRAYPASERIAAEYYSRIYESFETTFALQPRGGLVAMVIGDCTRYGQIEPVVDKCIQIGEEAGYDLFQMNFRTTHYGLGKYAYQFRADYHGEQANKRDGIIIFKKS